MSVISRFFTTAIVITTPSAVAANTTTDAEGLPVVASPTTVTTVCHVQPYRAAEGERVLGVELADQAKTVWLPASTNINHKSTAVIAGARYEVIGEADAWVVGSTNDHLETIMRRVT